MKKKFFPLVLAIFCLPLPACSADETSGFKEDVLRIASWDEYIDEGGEDSYVPDSEAMYEEFEAWYNETHPNHQIRVEYITLQDNETMYNKIKMGERFDLLCPSEYMIMKLKAENYLEKFDESFFDTSNENNYYAINRSDFINNIFTSCGIEEYTAGYMWGTAGFVYNADTVDREDMLTWKALVNPKYYHRITEKDNARDTYFSAVGLHYEDKLLALQNEYDLSDPDELKEYKAELKRLFNDTSDETIGEVAKLLATIRKNLYGIETDEGKEDVAMGRIDISYQWSGDAAYIIDEGEEFGTNLEYAIPSCGSNIWFDGYAIMKGTKNKDAAQAFINYISMPENAIRNTDYIGYTSCIVGEDMFEYLKEQYEDEEETDTVDYDVSWFFKKDSEDDSYVLHNVPTYQTVGKLFSQYPDEATANRCTIMDYFDKEANRKINLMWITIK